MHELVQQVLALAPDPWDVDVFLDKLEAERGGRPIDLCAMEWQPGSSTGGWKPHPDHDVVVYATNTTSWHQDVIILHEVGHMLFGHATGRQDPHDEWQAEQFARLFMAEIERRPRRAVDDFTRRVEQALG
ncbi:hypothetical protein DI005_20750 [Prauserella sp. PE36]|nr:hypothetical protein DI005_20750 [Prauserella sp. PE36]